jgi:hypothetical protein
MSSKIEVQTRNNSGGGLSEFIISNKMKQNYKMSFVITMEEEKTKCFFEESLINSPNKDTDKYTFFKQELFLKNEKINNKNETIKEEITKKTIQIVKIPKEKNFISNALVSYYQLWKTKLSLMVVITTLGSYYSIHQSLDSTSLWLSLGTFLQAGCANSLNQLFEIERDKKMNRTKMRPLCLDKISKTHATLQAIVVGLLGSWILYEKTNTTTTMLGVANIFIYSMIYTPLKVECHF